MPDADTKPAKSAPEQTKQADKTRDKYARKIAHWDERAAKWSKAKIVEEARSAAAGNFLGREFNETAESFYGRDEIARAARVGFLSRTEQVTCK